MPTGRDDSQIVHLDVKEARVYGNSISASPSSPVQSNLAVLGANAGSSRRTLAAHAPAAHRLAAPALPRDHALRVLATKPLLLPVQSFPSITFHQHPHTTTSTIHHTIITTHSHALQHRAPLQANAHQQDTTSFQARRRVQTPFRLHQSRKKLTSEPHPRPTHPPSFGSLIRACEIPDHSSL